MMGGLNVEERAEYIEEQKEKNMIAQCAHRGASKPAWRMSGPNGDVVTWPSLPRVYDRLKYITNGLDGAEIAQKIGSTRHAVYQQFGRSEKLSKEILAKYAQAFGCPLPWLLGETKKTNVEPESASVIRPKSAVRLEINGTFPIETILQMLPQGGYTAQRFCLRE